MDQTRGRGRGFALLDKIKQSQSTPTPAETSPQQSTAPSPISAQSIASSSTSAFGGRGRAMSALSMLQKPGGSTSNVPVSNIGPSQPVVTATGMGRGLKILDNLKLSSQITDSAQKEMSDLTKDMKGASLGSTPKSENRNKYLKEIKDTPPVIKLGTSGTPCEVTVNFIRLNFKENQVYEYEVRYEPDQDHKHLRVKLLNLHKSLIGEYTFDGTTMYSAKRLSNDITKLTSKNPYDESSVNLTIRFRRNRRLSEMIHIYNVLFKHIMYDLKLVRFGRQHFNELAAMQIPQHMLEVWPGYVTAVDEYEGGLMLTLDSAHRVLRTQNVLSLIHDMVEKEKANWKKAMTDALIGHSVMTTYNKKLYRVDSIDDKMSPRSTFEKTENGKVIQISYIDYYKNNYGIQIMDWDQPLLISRKSVLTSGSSVPTDFMFCLVPELCKLTGLTDEQRNNFHLMKDVATYTRITPNQRHAAFKQFLKNVLDNERAVGRLAGWGLSIAPETVALTARVLPPENIYFANDVQVTGKMIANWNNEATKYHMIQTVDLVRWVILYARRDEKVANDFADMILRCSRPMGMEIRKPELYMLPTDNTSAYVAGLKKYVIDKSLQLVICICPTARDDRYSAIKKICCADNPIPSQVINSRTIKNVQKLRAITQKIALQINCKLGGTLWSIKIPMKDVMIVGIDCYHDAVQRKQSVCAFVSSCNPSLTQWYSRAEFQQQGKEIIDILRNCLVESLKHYLNKNGTLPRKIFIFRDGVGDGQLNIINEYEVPQMMVSVKILDESYTPTLTYIIVQKRINTRIFRVLNGGLDNPDPGTVLDHGITRRDWYDFLIISQKVGQGTVTPTHYVVVYDDSGITPDQCQRLTYKLCHLYYNWPGTIRVPAPCQYAHKLAYLVGQCIHQEPAEALADKLFFL